MTNSEITLTVISVLGTISSILFAFLAFKRNSHADTKEVGRESGTVISDLGYIKSSIERIEKRLDNSEQKFDALLTGLTSIIERAVRSVFQTYVEALKKNNSFDKEAQVKALELARSEVTKQLSNETACFIKETYGDVNTFITSQIEATINLLKNE